MEQLSPEWFAARLGKVTASRLGDLMATNRSGPGAGRANYMAELICERLTGKTAERFQSDAMKWGTDNEPNARNAYVFFNDVEVTPAAFIVHPSIAQSGASPDGFVGDEGMVEIKCPQTATHLDTLLTETINLRYIYQMQWQMACTRRLWCDFVSYDPRLPPAMQMWVKRFERNEKTIGELESSIKTFLREMEDKITALHRRLGKPE